MFAKCVAVDTTAHHTMVTMTSTQNQLECLGIFFNLHRTPKVDFCVKVCVRLCSGSLACIKDGSEFIFFFFCCFRWRMWGKLKFTSRKKRQQKMCTHTQSIFYHFHAKSMPEIVFTQFINVLFVCSMLYGFVFRDNDRSRQLSYRCSCAQNCFPTISHIL